MAKDDKLDFDDLELPEGPTDSEALDDLMDSPELPAEDAAPEDPLATELPDLESPMPDEEGVPDELGDLGAPALGTVAEETEGEAGEGPVAEEEATEALPDAKEEEGKPKKKKKAKKKKEKKPKEAAAATGPSFIDKVLDASPYTVMLTVSFLAMVLAVLLLFAQLLDYNLDIKARELKEKTGAVPAVQSAAPSTNAAA